MLQATVKTKTSYNRYSTAFKTLVKANIISKEMRPLVNSISPSTLHYMRKCDYSTLIGLDVDEKISTQFEEVAAELARSQKLVRTLSTFLKAKNCITDVIGKLSKKSITKREMKNKIVETVDAIKEKLPLKKALKLFKLSRTTFNNWKKQLEHLCLDSPLNKCLRIWPSQLTKAEVGKMKSLFEDDNYKHYSLRSLYWHAFRNLSLNMALSTFYKYTAILGYKSSKPKHRRKRHTTGLRAEYPNQYWQADVTIFKPNDHTKVYIHLLIDNFSRRLLGWRASLKLSARSTKKMLEEAYETYINPGVPIPEIDLIVDGGSENKAEVDDFINESDVEIRKMVAGRQINFSNSMIEAANKKMKYGYLYRNEIDDYEHLVRVLPGYINDYNNTPNGALSGLTPIEAYNGEKFDQTGYRKALAASHEQRVNTNRRHSCPSCSDEATVTDKKEVASL